MLAAAALVAGDPVAGLVEDGRRPENVGDG